MGKSLGSAVRAEMEGLDGCSYIVELVLVVCVMQVVLCGNWGKLTFSNSKLKVKELERKPCGKYHAL